MSTRAHVGIKNNDKSFEVIFTHWDGYPSHHGPILLKKYTNAKQVRALMAYGNHEILDERPEWGSPWGESDKYKTFEDMCIGLRESWGCYIYIFDVKHSRWLFSKMGTQKIKLKALNMVDCKPYEGD